MRTFIFISVLFSMFIVAIVAGYKPSLIENEYNRIKAPIEKHFAEKREEIWRNAKNAEWQAWATSRLVPADCSSSPTALKEVECKSERQLQIDAFERTWASRIAQGWKPSGIE